MKVLCKLFYMLHPTQWGVFTCTGWLTDECLIKNQLVLRWPSAERAKHTVVCLDYVLEIRLGTYSDPDFIYRFKGDKS
jgi:hypothetical protein